jgi:hypothetical protein
LPYDQSSYLIGYLDSGVVGDAQLLNLVTADRLNDFYETHSLNVPIREAIRFSGERIAPRTASK